MTIEELEKIIRENTWVELGKGKYNVAYKSAKPITIEGYPPSYWVRKVPQNDKHKIPYSTIARAVRKWRLLNPSYPVYEGKDSWVAPYLGSQQATDEQIAIKVIEIYTRTKNIIIDACVLRNFLVYNSDVVCIDVDLATRRGSVPSKEFPIDKVPEFLNDCKRVNPLTASVIGGLLWLEECFSDDQIKEDYLNVRFLKKLDTLRLLGKKIDAAMAAALQELLDEEHPRYEISPPFLIPFLEAGKVPHPMTPGKFHPIHQAAEFGLVKYVRAFLAVNPELINASGPDKLTPLDMAILRGKTAVGCFLIEAGALSSQLHFSSCKKSLNQLIAEENLDAVRLLIKHNPDLLNLRGSDGLTPLHYSIKYNRYKIFIFLLEAGADINKVVLPTADFASSAYMNALDLAIDERHDEQFITPLLEKGATCNKPYTAVQWGLLSQVVSLVEMHPDCINARDSRNQTALLWASAKGHADIVAFLINRGAELNTATQCPDKSCHNFTALDWARERGHTAVISLLEAAGAKANKIPAVEAKVVDTAPTLVKPSGGEPASPTLSAQKCGFFKNAEPTARGEAAGVVAKSEAEANIAISAAGPSFSY